MKMKKQYISLQVEVLPIGILSVLCSSNSGLTVSDQNESQYTGRAPRKTEVF
jgi:hypothetical protein